MDIFEFGNQYRYIYLMDLIDQKKDYHNNIAVNMRRSSSYEENKKKLVDRVLKLIVATNQAMPQKIKEMVELPEISLEEPDSLLKDLISFDKRAMEKFIENKIQIDSNLSFVIITLVACHQKGSHHYHNLTSSLNKHYDNKKKHITTETMMETSKLSFEQIKDFIKNNQTKGIQVKGIHTFLCFMFFHPLYLQDMEKKANSLTSDFHTKMTTIEKSISKIKETGKVFFNISPQSDTTKSSQKITLDSKLYERLDQHNSLVAYQKHLDKLSTLEKEVSILEQQLLTKK